MVVTQAFNGSGDTRTPTGINVIAFWLFQLPFAYIAAFYLELGALGVFMAITLAEILLAIIAIILFKRGRWKQFQV